MIHVVFHYGSQRSTYAFRRVEVTPGLVVFNDDSDMHLRVGGRRDRWVASDKLQKYVGRNNTNLITGVSIR